MLVIFCISVYNFVIYISVYILVISCVSVYIIYIYDILYFSIYIGDVFKRGLLVATLSDEEHLILTINLHRSQTQDKVFEARVRCCPMLVFKSKSKELV